MLLTVSSFTLLFCVHSESTVGQHCQHRALEIFYVVCFQYRLCWSQCNHRLSRIFFYKYRYLKELTPSSCFPFVTSNQLLTVTLLLSVLIQCHIILSLVLFSGLLVISWSPSCLPNLVCYVLWLLKVHFVL